MKNPFDLVLTELNERELRALVVECLCTIKLSPAFSHLPEQSLLQLHAVAAGIRIGSEEYDAWSVSGSRESGELLSGGCRSR
jgi:hypothetical protein